MIHIDSNTFFSTKLHPTKPTLKDNDLKVHTNPKAPYIKSFYPQKAFMTFVFISSFQTNHKKLIKNVLVFFAHSIFLIFLCTSIQTKTSHRSTDSQSVGRVYIHFSHRLRSVYQFIDLVSSTSTGVSFARSAV